MRLPAPAFCASDWHCRSAPAKPPRSAPFPEPTLVTKNLMFVCCSCKLALELSDSNATITTREKPVVFFIPVLLSIAALALGRGPHS